MKSFCKEVKAEFKKISWIPKNKLMKELGNLSIITLILTLCIFLSDNIFSYIVSAILSLI